MRFVLFFLCLIVTACKHTTFSPENDGNFCHTENFKTVVKDTNEARLLLDQDFLQDQRDHFKERGQHVFIDRAILKSPEYKNSRPGYALIANLGYVKGECENNHYTIMAWAELHHTNIHTKNEYTSFVQLSGIVSEIRPYEFEVDGVLSATDGNINSDTNSYDFNRYFHQERGKFIFRRKEHPQYWTMDLSNFKSNISDRFESLDLYVTKNPQDIFN